MHNFSRCPNRYKRGEGINLPSSLVLVIFAVATLSEGPSVCCTNILCSFCFPAAWLVWTGLIHYIALPRRFRNSGSYVGRIFRHYGRKKKKSFCVTREFSGPMICTTHARNLSWRCDDTNCNPSFSFPLCCYTVCVVTESAGVLGRTHPEATISGQWAISYLLYVHAEANSLQVFESDGGYVLHILWFSPA